LLIINKFAYFPILEVQLIWRKLERGIETPNVADREAPLNFIAALIADWLEQQSAS
jgi:hypothetical protein